MATYPGDPLTPGVGATPGAKRLAISEAKSILRIPVIPISYADAQPLLAALAGPVAPKKWRGALPITYHIGPGPAQVHLSISSDWSQKPLYDVIAKIRGAHSPDEWVVRGNHRDGWVFGAWDPLSGEVAMLAEAKAIGALLKSGWRPERTLVYASWDGEEPGLLGSTGSDYTPFLQHLGVTTLSIEYQGEDDDAGIYHSKYDSFDHYVRFGDPTFAYGVAEAQTVGHVVLRMADAEVLPLQFTAFASTASDYLQQLRQLVDEKRQHAHELAELLDQNAFGLATDPMRVVSPPEREAAVPQVDFAPLESAVELLQRSAQAYDVAYARLTTGELHLDAAHRRQLNSLLQGMEHRLTDARGLPGRDWFKHFVYAPGMLTGYAVKTLPAVREAIDAGRWDEVNRYAAITAQVLRAYGDAATALLNRGT